MTDQREKPGYLLRLVWLGSGHLMLVIGVIGIVVPLLPTTPFLLLAAFCYARGSDKFEHWLLNHKHLGPPVRAWREHRVIRPWAKVLAALVITSSMVWVATRPQIPSAGKIGMAAVVLPVLVFILSRRSRVS
jgi:hypothetical protein